MNFNELLKALFPGCIFSVATHRIETAAALSQVVMSDRFVENPSRSVLSLTIEVDSTFFFGPLRHVGEGVQASTILCALIKADKEDMIAALIKAIPE